MTVDHDHMYMVNPAHTSAVEAHAFQGFNEAVSLHVNLAYQHPQLSKTFYEVGGAPNVITFSTKLDVAVNGSEFSTMVQLPSELNQGSNPSIDVIIPLSNSLEGGKVVLKADDQVLLMSSVGALTTSGSICDIHNGFGNTPLNQLLRQQAVIVPVYFGDWHMPVGSIMLRNAQMRVNGKPVGWRESKHLEVDNMAQYGKVFVGMINEIVNRRETQLVYKPLPGLTKTFTPIPVIGYTTIEALMHLPTSLTADQLEALLGGKPPMTPSPCGRYGLDCATARRRRDATDAGGDRTSPSNRHGFRLACGGP